MLLVQLGGYNGVSFYASSIFEAAGDALTHNLINELKGVLGEE